MRILLALLLVPSLALAQGTRPPSGEGGPEQGAAKHPMPPDAELISAAEVQAPVAAVPERLFATVDVWKLEAGQHLAELASDALIGGASEAATLVRVRLGLSEHFEVGVGQAVSRTSGQPLSLASTPITVRYSLGASPGEVPGNPVVEAEWAPRSLSSYRGQARLLLSGEPVPGLAVAANLYAGQNFGRSAGLEGRYGATFGASRPVEVLGRLVRAGAEGRFGVEDEDGLSPRLVIQAGPALQGAVGPVGVFAAALLDLSQGTVRGRPAVTLSLPF